MRALRAWFLRLTNTFGKSRRESEVAAELDAHLNLHIQDNLRAGMDAHEARRQALLKLGGLEQTRELYRERRSLPFIEMFFQDARYALRTLRQNPVFAGVAVLTLALGIGATSAVFSVVHSVLLRALPYHDAARLVWVADFLPRQHSNVVLEAEYFSWHRDNRVFDGVAAYQTGQTFTLTSAGEATRLNAGGVTQNFFDVLGIQPQRGRFFLPEEDRPGAGHTVVLSDSLWRQRFSADPLLVGRVIALDNEPYTVVGILPPDFEFLDNSPADVIVPSALEHQEIAINKPQRLVRVVARLKPGVTIAGAASKLDAINQRMWATLPPGFARMMQGGRVQVTPLRERLVGKVRPALLMLMAAIAFVLLIVCVNIANLQLARSVAREKEIAIRGALGAGRARLVRQLLTENAMLSIAGGTLGMLLAAWLVQLLRMHAPGEIPHLAAARLNPSVLAFTFVISLATGLLFGLAPILAAFRVPIVETIKETGSPSGAGLKIRRSHDVLTVAELALALILFVGAGLLVRSFAQITSIAPGFDAQGVLTARVSLPLNVYHTREQQLAFTRRLSERLNVLPGVESAGLTDVLPLQGFDSATGIDVEGQPPEAPGRPPGVGDIKVTPGYFSALRVRLTSGRLLTERDDRNAPNVLVVNQSFVRRFFSNENPLGRRIRPGEDWWTIVGVVEDSKQMGLATEVEPEIFVPLEKWTSPELNLALRTAGDPLALTAAIHSVVRELDPNIPLYGVQTMGSLLGREVASQRFNAALLSAFALFAMALAAVGIYGVMTYAVRQRTREIGIRMALGASQRAVLRMVLAHGAALAFVGLLAGLAAAFALTRLMGSLLYRVRPTDPLTFVAVSLALLGVALGACSLPALRAIRVDAMVALRHE
jgi:predicted permease